MNLHLLGAGIWMPEAPDWSAFERGLKLGFVPAGDPGAVPAADLIPARERRRASRPIRLGVDVAAQACAAAGVPFSSPAAVFTSAMADTDVTDYLCRALTAAPVMLSPTRFHNSVHNAPAGYWSISAENRENAGYVAGGEHSFAVALLETAALAMEEARPVLLVALDIANRPPFHGIRPIDRDFAAAMLFAAEPGERSGPTLSLAIERGIADAVVPRDPLLAEAAADNPSARCLALLEAYALSRDLTDPLPLNAHATLCVRMTAVSPHALATDGGRAGARAAGE